ncbi:MAG: hypothetical protein M1335_04770 [Chloroflexi bacterium]|nr:hypothetical protein [Chloroflexota bacterium]
MIFVLSREEAIPNAPDLSIERKQAVGVVDQYQKAVKAKDSKTAWDALSVTLQKGSTLDTFKKAIKDFPKPFKNYRMDAKNTDLLVNMPFASEYAATLPKSYMDTAWAVTVKFPDVDQASQDAVKSFVLIQENGKYKIYDIR